MDRKLLLSVLFVALLIVLFLPVSSHADASVRQDSCLIWTDGQGKTWAQAYFTVINYSLPADVCDLHFVPEPFPAEPGCTILQAGSPEGWTGVLDPGGGASWFANTPGDCIPAGGWKSGFSILLDPDYCCYVTQFTGPAGEVLLEQEECTCSALPVEETTWGQIKLLNE